MKINNSTFIVTGGASGLGAATVEALHQQGANVVIADLNCEAGNALVERLGDRSLFVATDVISEESARACVHAAAELFGSLQGLINCAGIGVAEKIVSKEGPQALSRFAKVVQINLIGTFNMLSQAAAVMSSGPMGESGERGVIINTASAAAFEGQIGQAAYAASKGGVVSLTLPAARELARSGIRVVTIAPGLFLTPMMAALPAETQKALGDSVPFPQRLGQAAEYAALALHVVENSMLNGETIRLDGALRLAPR